MRTLALALLTATAAAAGADLPARTRPEFTTGQVRRTHAELDRRWAAWSRSRERASVRDFFAAALDAAATGWHAERVARLLEWGAGEQDLATNSATYGNFHWYVGDDAVYDRNAVQFAMQKASLLALLHRGRLDSAAARWLGAILPPAAEGVRRQKVNVDYTNIHLMKTWNLLALGEVLKRPDLEAEGARAFADWMAYTRTNGIHEYLSPTYYAVDFESLGLMARYARDPELRARALRALEYLWTDVAANWFAPAARLGGAHSRDYDYLTGHGGLDRWAARAGFPGLDPPAEEPDVFTAHAWVAPRPSWVARASPTPRFVAQRWGPGLQQWAAHYVGSTFSLGSSGAAYHNMDKTLVANFSGGAEMPSVFFFFDGRMDPYGTRRIRERSGHLKSLHLRPQVGTAQRGTDILQVAALDLAGRDLGHDRESLTGVFAHVVFPAGVQVWMNDSPLDLRAGATQAMPSGAALYLRHRGAVIGLRAPAARAVDGSAAPAEVVADGGARGAARLTWTFAPRAVTSGVAAVALWVRGAEGLDEAAFAAFRRDFRSADGRAALTESRIDAQVSIRDAPLRVTMGLRPVGVVAVEGFDPALTNALLSIDSRDIGREILGADTRR